MVLIGRIRLRAIEPERVGRARAIGRVQVGIVGQQRRARQQIVDIPRRVLGGLENGLTFGIQRIRIRAEIMVERTVLVEDDDEVLDRGPGRQVVGRNRALVRLVIVLAGGHRTRRRRRDRDSKQRRRGEQNRLHSQVSHLFFFFLKGISSRARRQIGNLSDSHV